MHRRPGIRFYDDPGLRLAVRARQVLGGEAPVRVDVDGQPLPGIEQLHEQTGIGAVPGDVLRTQPRRRVAGHRVGQQAAIGQPGHPVGFRAEPGGYRCDPVLGPVFMPGGPAQPVDPAGTAIEHLRHVGPKHDRLHGNDLQKAICGDRRVSRPGCQALNHPSGITSMTSGRVTSRDIGPAVDPGR
jgi:hypothetical protein